MSHIGTVVTQATTHDIQRLGVDGVDRKIAETCDNEEIMNIISELDGTKHFAIFRKKFSK